MRDTRGSRSNLNKLTPLTVATLAATVLAACGGNGNMYTMTGGYTNTMTGGGTTGGTATPSSVTLTSPGNNVNRMVSLTATPTAGSGKTITRVDFMVDGAVVGTATMSPYTVKWDSSTVMDGTHSLTAKVTDSGGMTATSTAVSVSVLNKPTFTVALSAAQLFPAPASTATATATLSFNLVTGAGSGKVVLTGLTATGVAIHAGFAGATGTAIVTLMQNATNAAEWDLSSTAMLTADQITALLEGGLYLEATSAANPNGEVRGQIAPANISIAWTKLSGAQETPPVATTATGVAAATVDMAANTVSVYVNTTGATDATAVELDTQLKGATPTKLVSLTKDAVNMGSWFVMQSPVTATDVANFNNGLWYVNVLTPADPNGAIRGQLMPATSIMTTPTLTQLQTEIFTPKCSGCHNGVGTVPPGALNLTAGGTYKALVNVATGEQPTLKYVVPGDPANSYLVQKLMGSAGISGVRMPEGGPYLDDATLAQVVAWITAGAPNN